MIFFMGGPQLGELEAGFVASLFASVAIGRERRRRLGRHRHDPRRRVRRVAREGRARLRVDPRRAADIVRKRQEKKRREEEDFLRRGKRDAALDLCAAGHLRGIGGGGAGRGRTSPNHLLRNPPPLPLRLPLLPLPPKQKNPSPRSPTSCRVCSSGTSAPSAAGASRPSPACRASRSRSTSAARAAASGRRPTAARRGIAVSDKFFKTGSVGALAVVAVRPERRLRRDGRGLHPRQRLRRRRRLEVGRRGQDVGYDGPRGHAADPARARPPDESGRRLRRGPRPHVRPESGPRDLPLAGRREDVEEGPLRRREDGRVRSRHGRRRTRACSRRASGRWAASRGPSRAAAPAAASGRRRTAATRGRSSRAGCPRASSGASGSPSRPRGPSAPGPIVEAEKGGVFRTDDGGETWKKVNDENKLKQRAWYYSHVYADPANADAVYVLNVGFFRSGDGGKTFDAIRTPHGDNHDLWIDPDGPARG